MPEEEYLIRSARQSLGVAEAIADGLSVDAGAIAAYMATRNDQDATQTERARTRSGRPRPDYEIDDEVSFIRAVEEADIFRGWLLSIASTHGVECRKTACSTCAMTRSALAAVVGSRRLELERREKLYGNKETRNT